MRTMTYEQLRQTVGEAHGDKNNRGWRKNQKPTNKKKSWLREDDDDADDLEVDDETDEPEEDEQVKIVVFKTTDKYLVDILQGAINGITISTTDDVQTFGPDSFSDIEVNDWSEDDVEDDDEDDVEVEDDEELDVEED